MWRKRAIPVESGNYWGYASTVHLRPRQAAICWAIERVLYQATCLYNKVVPIVTLFEPAWGCQICYQKWRYYGLIGHPCNPKPMILCHNADNSICLVIC